LSTSRPFAYNTGSTISGTIQLGDLAIGVDPLDYSGSVGGVRWWEGPDEDLGYVICRPNYNGNQPNPDNVPAYIRFSRSKLKTEQSFVELVNTVFNQTFTTGNECNNYLDSNGYWSSWVNTTPTPTPTNTMTPTPTTTPLPAYNVDINVRNENSGVTQNFKIKYSINSGSTWNDLLTGSGNYPNYNSITGLQSYSGGSMWLGFVDTSDNNLAYGSGLFSSDYSSLCGILTPYKLNNITANTTNYINMKVIGGSYVSCPLPTPTPTPTITPTNTITPTITPTNTITPTVTPSVTPSVTLSVTPTLTPTPTPSSVVTSGRTFSQAFTGGTAPTSAIETAWNVFRTGLTATYTQFVWSSTNGNSITVSDPTQVQVLANGLRLGISTGVTINSVVWRVGTGCGTPKIGGTAIELSNVGSCTASSTYALRPQINNQNWGGTNQSTVNAPSQTITLTFS